MEDVLSIHVEWWEWPGEGFLEEVRRRGYQAKDNRPPGVAGRPHLVYYAEEGVDDETARVALGIALPPHLWVLWDLDLPTLGFFIQQHQHFMVQWSGRSEADVAREIKRMQAAVIAAGTDRPEIMRMVVAPINRDGNRAQRRARRRYR